MLWNYVYDHLLCDILRPGEAFIDFIAVSEKARYAAAQYTLDRLNVQYLQLCNLCMSYGHLPKYACVFGEPPSCSVAVSRR